MCAKCVTKSGRLGLREDRKWDEGLEGQGACGSQTMWADMGKSKTLTQSWRVWDRKLLETF